MATSGPGATNLVTPLADAFLDSVPIVAITGQVTSRSIGTDAFQEADISGITMQITKHNYLITDTDVIPRAVAEAFHIASTGRPGPVLIDISKDALQAQTTFVWPPKLDLPGYRPVAKPHSKQIREAARLIMEARRPVLYVGGGVIRSGASDELRELVAGTGANDSPADIQNRTTRLHDEPGRLADLLAMRFGHGAVTRKVELRRPHEGGLGLQRILADVNQDRAGTACRGNVKRLG